MVRTRSPRAAIDAADALRALERVPALAEPAARLQALLELTPLPTAAAVAVVEGDVALSAAVLRAANDPAGPWPGRVDSVLSAVVLLQADGLREAVAPLRTIGFLDRPAPWGDGVAAAFRHARASARAADRLAVLTGHRHRDRLVTAAVLHDVGKLVLLGSGRDPGEGHAQAGAHALAAAGLPAALTDPIAAHEDQRPRGDAAYLRAADLLGYAVQGEEVDAARLRTALRAVGLSSRDLQALLFDLPDAHDLPARAVDPCPLSERELQVLQHLAAGAVYKQIAQDLSLSVSTVRTHLHHVYAKLGAVDRAQAVLTARGRGWV